MIADPICSIFIALLTLLRRATAIPRPFSLQQRWAATEAIDGNPDAPYAGRHRQAARQHTDQGKRLFGHHIHPHGAAQLSSIQGVVSCKEPRFWTLSGFVILHALTDTTRARCSDQTYGTVVLVIKATACDTDVLADAQRVFKAV